MKAMDPRSAQPNGNRHAYIPQHVSEAMSQQMQQSVPAHLRQYVNPDKPVYVPKHVEQQLNQHMQNTMPAHLKGYSGAYLQQKVVQPGLNSMASAAPRPAAPVAPTPNQLRQDHSGVNAGQYDARFNNNLFAPDQPGQPSPQQPYPEQGPAPQTPGQQPYDFIMNPNQPAPSSSKLPKLPSGMPLPQKILVIGGALLVLLIVLAVGRSLLGGSSGLDGYITVAQDQQELIHLLTPQQEDLTASLADDTRNFAATARVTLVSSQGQVVQYLASNGQKVEGKKLNLKINPQTDEQLNTAAAAGTYDETFREIMKSELNSYMNDMSAVYKEATGKKGRALLSDQYNQAQLLLKQLDPASAGN